jgi:hypothetical protein
MPNKEMNPREWQPPKTSVLSCPQLGCEHRKCSGCKSVNAPPGSFPFFASATDCSPDCLQGGGHLRSPEHMKQALKRLQCCKCGQANPLTHWRWLASLGPPRRETALDLAERV